MNNHLDELVKDLSDIYDGESKNTFITLYKEKDTNLKFFEKRKLACKSVLTGEEKENFSKTIDDIDKFLGKNSKFQGVIFASKNNNFFKSVSLPVKIKDSFIVDSSPYIRPLSRILDEWESFTLVLINSNYSKIFSISLGKVIEEKTLSKDIMNKHKKGGWSQARFQRLRKGAINSFFSEVEKALNKFANNQIIIAGPGQAKLHFKDSLSPNIKKRIVATIDISIDDEKQLLKDSISVISELEKEKSHNATKNLKNEILKDGLAAYGIKETLQAIKNGQVEQLIVEKNFKKKGYICERCQILKIGSVKKCSNCGGDVSEVDVIEEIIEFGKRTDVDIEFTDDEEISNLGHIGAILRYKL